MYQSVRVSITPQSRVDWLLDSYLASLHLGSRALPAPHLPLFYGGPSHVTGTRSSPSREEGEPMVG